MISIWLRVRVRWCKLELGGRVHHCADWKVGQVSFCVRTLKIVSASTCSHSNNKDDMSCTTCDPLWAHRPNHNLYKNLGRCKDEIPQIDNGLGDQHDPDDFRPFLIIPLIITALILVSGMYQIILNVILLNSMLLMCLEFTGIQSISALTIMALIRISLDWSIRVCII